MISFRQPLTHVDEAEGTPEVFKTDSKCKSRLKALVTGIAVITMLISGCVFHQTIQILLDAFIAGCAKLGWKASAAVFLTTAATNLFMLPCFPLMVGAGLVFPKMYGLAAGPAVGVASVFTGMWAGSLVAFQLGRTLFKRWAEDELHSMEWMQVINKMVEDQGLCMVFLARMSPMLPAEVFNYACSLTHLTLFEYAIGCTGSVIPVAIWVYSTASASSAIASSHQAQTETEERNIMLLVINIMVLAALSIALCFAVKKYRAQAKASTDNFAKEHSLSPAHQCMILMKVSSQDFSFRSQLDSTDKSSDQQAVV